MRSPQDEQPTNGARGKEPEGNFPYCSSQNLYMKYWQSMINCNPVKNTSRFYIDENGNWILEYIKK